MRAAGDSRVLVQEPASGVAGSTVAEVMVRYPKVLPADATVGQVRADFEDDHVHMVLLTRGNVACGTVIRGDIPDSATDARRAISFAHLAGRTVSPTMPTIVVLRSLVAGQQRRLAVVDNDGHLVGLLCLKARGTGFCSDADVAARTQDRA